MMLPQTSQLRLTPREAEIMRLAARGDTREEMAHTLAIDIETVRSHIRNINVRLEARNMRQAVAISIVNKLITV